MKEKTLAIMIQELDETILKYESTKPALCKRLKMQRDLLADKLKKLEES